MLSRQALAGAQERIVRDHTTFEIALQFTAKLTHGLKKELRGIRDDVEGDSDYGSPFGPSSFSVQMSHDCEANSRRASAVHR